MEYFKQYEQTIQRLSDAVYLCDEAGIIRMYNRAAADLWGKEPVAGKELCFQAVSLLGPDGSVLEGDRHPVTKVLKHHHNEENTQLILKRADGTLRYIIQSTAPLFDIWGKLTGVVNRMVDITGRCG